MRPQSPKLAQAQAAFEAGRFEQARTLLQRLVAASPNEVEAIDLLRTVLQRLNLHQQALYYALRAAQLAPDHAGVRGELGLLQYNLGKIDDAEASFKEAVRLDPTFSPARAALLAILITQDRLAEAEPIAEAGLSFDPGHGELNMKLGAVEMETLRMREAFERLASMRFRHGGGALAHERLVEYQATLANYAGLYPDDSAEPLTPTRISNLHKEAGQIIEPDRSVRVQAPTPRVRAADQPLRVAVASPDLRGHPVAYFIEPFLRHADPARIELIAFATGPSDATTDRLKPRFAAWHDLSRSNPLGLAKAIRDAQPDILIELAGLTISHILPALSTRPAPVQVTYLGYPNTTGCRFIDFRIVDSITDPVGVADTLCTEKLVRIDPCFLCYQPPDDTPDRPQPDPSRPFTFCCFNRVQKISRQTLTMWAEILKSVPGARLALKDGPLKDGQTKTLILRELSRWGVDPDRVDTLPMTTHQRDHWLALGRCDVSLDPFPYHGTTTTCEALLMGTPVITRAGPTHVARVGASILSGAGCPELIAHSSDEYIKLAVGLANDPARLAAYHRDLPAKFRAGPICDGPAFANRLTLALEAMAPAQAIS